MTVYYALHQLWGDRSANLAAYCCTKPEPAKCRPCRTKKRNWLADMGFAVRDAKDCPGCKVFASRAAKPACRPALFTSRPDHLLFYDFTISFPLGSKQEGGFCISGRNACMSARHFHQSAGPFAILPFYYFTILLFFSFSMSLFYYFISIRFFAGGFCISGRMTCMSARHFTSQPDRLYYFTILLFYYFISIRFQAGGFCISSRKTCMSARHFHHVVGSRPNRLLFYCFTISFQLGSMRRFLLFGPQNLHVSSPFSPVGRTIYHVTILLFDYQLGSRREDFASGAAKPVCRPAISPLGRTVYRSTM